MRPSDDWTADDIATSAQQGWRLVYVWSEKHQRLEYELRTIKGDLLIQNSGYGASRNKLVERAMQLIFQSKLGSLRPQPKRKA
jgi:hypothetical protein